MNRSLLLHRICKVLGYHHYYENKYGIKVHNRHVSCCPTIIKRGFVDPKEVRLGFDGLKDCYTLVDVPMAESPHTELMNAILSGKDINNCDYIIRERRGYLDGRYGIRPNNHEMILDEMVEVIKQKSYPPVLIYEVGARKYAYDGKHRLALCCALGIKCKCAYIDKSFFKYDKYTNRIYDEMSKRSNYDKNIKLLETIIK